MIDAQDIAIFKSQKDYVRNKQKLLEYIHYAQMWQVLLVIFSYAAFTCDIILVITLIVFFIRYRKMMQAMLTAFINMNTSNSGIPSAKENPISRTFPPLFMIKISEEEKIVEDLQEIESMQLTVQVIMVIVCILVALIVLYYCCKKFARSFLLVSAVSGPFTSRLAVCICFSWFSHSEVCAFVLGNICERFARRDLC